MKIIAYLAQMEWAGDRGEPNRDGLQRINTNATEGTSTSAHIEAAWTTTCRSVATGTVARRARQFGDELEGPGRTGARGCLLLRLRLRLRMRCGCWLAWLTVRVGRSCTIRESWRAEARFQMGQN